MGEVLSHPLMQSALLFAIVLGLLALIAVVALKVREMRERREQRSASDLLTDFREMHTQGVLSDVEYRTIKAKLTSQLQQELKDNEESG